MEHYISMFVRAVFMRTLHYHSSWECVHSLPVSKKVQLRGSWCCCLLWYLVFQYQSVISLTPMFCHQGHCHGPVSQTLI